MTDVAPVSDSKPVYQSKIIWSAVALEILTLLQKDLSSFEGLLPTDLYQAASMGLPLMIVVFRTYFSGKTLTILPK